MLVPLVVSKSPFGLEALFTVVAGKALTTLQYIFFLQPIHNFFIYCTLHIEISCLPLVLTSYMLGQLFQN